MKFGNGWIAGVAVGYGLDNGVAIEGEFSVIQNRLKQETLAFPAGATTIALDGRLNTYALMINGYYRFTSSSAFTPYVGVGIGTALMNIKAKPESDPNWFQDNDIEFAYQVIAGFSIAINANTSVGAEYRFFDTATPSFTENVTVQFDNQSHNLLIKLTHKFGQHPQ